MSNGLACITLDVMPTDVTVEYIVHYINETGQRMHHSLKVSIWLISYL